MVGKNPDTKRVKVGDWSGLRPFVFCELRRFL